MCRELGHKIAPGRQPGANPRDNERASSYLAKHNTGYVSMQYARDRP
jgi:hypothetical protein